jgi:hypothetical protein
MADKNGNKNCLEEQQCPECGQAEHMLVTAISTFTILDDGDSDHNSVEYGDNETAQCRDCGCTKTVGDFRAAYRKAHPCAEGPVVVELSSKAFGQERFDYDGLPEALEGVERLFFKCQEQVKEDAVPRRVSILINPPGRDPATGWDVEDLMGKGGSGG